MKTLLFVEDDELMIRFFGRLFRLNDYSVVMSPNGEDGLSKARELKPDLIFLDIMMPKMNGIEVLTELRSDPETKDLRVIMLTNLGETSVMGKAKELGVADYLIKSDISEKDLLSIVKKYLG